MAYLQINAGGAVVGTSANPQDMTQAVYGGLSQVEVADNDPRIATFLAPKPLPPSPRAWLERLTPSTQAAIAAAGASNPAILLWLLKAAGSPAIDVTAAETIQGVGALVAAGVITAADQTTLLTP